MLDVKEDQAFYKKMKSTIFAFLNQCKYLYWSLQMQHHALIRRQSPMTCLFVQVDLMLRRKVSNSIQLIIDDNRYCLTIVELVTKKSCTIRLHSSMYDKKTMVPFTLVKLQTIRLTFFENLLPDQILWKKMYLFLWLCYIAQRMVLCTVLFTKCKFFYTSFQLRIIVLLLFSLQY